MTPGELKSGGSGLEIAYGVHPSPFGDCVLAATERGVCGCHFLGGREPKAVLERERRRFDAASWRNDPDRTAPLVRCLFAAWDEAEGPRSPAGNSARPSPAEPEPPSGGSRETSAEGREPPSEFGHSTREPLYVLLEGTNFQIQVWQALLRIPPGAVVSYGRVAEHLGRPNGARAVANAVASNPIAYLIPCHRVIRSTGEFGGYQSGVERKRVLLAREGARSAL